MIRLRNNPVEGSSVTLNLSFRDAFGVYYVPTKLNYTLLALNEDKEDWSVVDNLYKVPVEPQSNVVLNIPDMKQIEGTTLSRKIIIEYEAYLNNQYCDYTDEVNFDVQPMPTITNEPVNPPEPLPQYVEILSCNLSSGSSVSAPLAPVFKLRTNVPCNSDDAIAFVKDKFDNTISCIVISDSTKTMFGITPNDILNKNTRYTLTVDNLIAEVGEYGLKNSFEFNFKTADIGDIEDEKSITVTENGYFEIIPDEGFESIKKVGVDVNLPLEEDKELYIDENGKYDLFPSEDFIAMKNGKITVEVHGTAKPEQSKSVEITDNGTTTVLPDEGRVLSSVEINTNVEISGIEANKEVTISENGTTQILPTEPNDAMEKVTVTTEVPIPQIESGKTQSITENGTVLIEPSSGYDALENVEVSVNVVPTGIEANKEVTITENGETEITPSTGYSSMNKVTATIDVPLPVIEANREITITDNGETEINPTLGNNAMSKVTATIAVPIPSLQENKNETIDVSSYSDSVEITPDTTYDAMEKVTVSLSNIPIIESNKSETIDVETYSTPIEITPSTGNDGMEKATVTLTNLTRLYVWKDSAATPNPHYMYTTYSDVSRCNGHAYQCGTVKNALLIMKNVEVSGDSLYVSGYPNSHYYRDPDNDMTH